MSGKEIKLDIDHFDGKLEEWKWKDINPKFALFTSPIPISLCLIGVLYSYECDFILNIWMIIMGFLIQIELIYLSVYFQRSTANSNTEFDLDDAIFENYENQSVKDPMLRKAVRLHAKIGLLALFGIIKCYLVLSESSYCNGLVFWPSFIVSLFYCISFFVIISIAIRKMRTRKVQNII